MTKKELMELRINGNSNITFYQQLILNLSKNLLNVDIARNIGPHDSGNLVVKTAGVIINEMVTSINNVV